MNLFEQKINQGPKIEKVVTPGGNEVSSSAERGGIILGIKFQDKEILYLDNEIFKNVENPVRGGIQILFPNAGPIPGELQEGELKNLKQHGFARNEKWETETIDNGFIETLNSSEETEKIYPYKFKLTIKVEFDTDNSLTITQITENLEKDKEMPISSGLHPYFKVPNDEKKNIKFNYPGGEIIEEKIKNWEDDIKAISLENPNMPIEIDIPGLGTLVFEISEEYKRIWVWSQAGKDFICIEPVMRDKGGIISDPVKIKPGEKNIVSFKIIMKEN